MTEVAAIPLKLTVLDPCVVPKLVPVMATTVEPATPELGVMLLMTGVGEAI